jgi:hypothetical protein
MDTARHIMRRSENHGLPNALARLSSSLAEFEGTEQLRACRSAKNKMTRRLRSFRSPLRRRSSRGRLYGSQNQNRLIGAFCHSSVTGHPGRRCEKRFVVPVQHIATVGRPRRPGPKAPRCRPQTVLSLRTEVTGDRLVIRAS